MYKEVREFLLDNFNVKEKTMGERPPKRVDGTLYVEAIVGCPNCLDVIDLFDIEGINDDYQLYDLLFSNEGWGTKDADLIIKCPDCNTTLHIREKRWC